MLTVANKTVALLYTAHSVITEDSCYWLKANDVRQILTGRKMILGNHDAIIPIGTIAAKQMGWGNVPISTLKNPDFKTGDWVTIHANGEIRRTRS